MKAENDWQILCGCNGRSRTIEQYNFRRKRPMDLGSTHKAAKVELCVKKVLAPMKSVNTLKVVKSRAYTNRWPQRHRGLRPKRDFVHCVSNHCVYTPGPEPLGVGRIVTGVAGDAQSIDVGLIDNVFR